MLFSLFAFLLFLGPLVFFHELGHFALARFFGVRVEVFSIGFGKTLFSFKRGDTDYRFSLIPLGGYVKMYGENLLERDNIPEAEREYAYCHKSKWARFWIIFAGPFTNFVLAFCLYFFLALKGEEIREFKVSDIPSDSLMSQAGFKLGDIVKKINGETFYTQEDMVFLDQTTNVFTVTRAGESVDLTVSAKPEDLLKDYIMNSGYLIEPIFYNVRGQEFILSHLETYDENFNLSFQEIVKKGGNLFFLFSKDKKSLEQKIVIAPEAKDRKQALLSELEKSQFFRSDVSINRVMPDSPAAKVGMIGKSVVREVDGKRILSFNDLREVLQQSDGRDVDIKYIDFQGNEYSKRLRPKATEYEGKNYYSIGIESGILVHKGKKVFIDGQGFVAGAKSSFKRTKIAFIKTYRVLRDMIFGKADVWNNLGGPIAIANVASSSLKISIEFFLRFMAIMSINLGLMNLLPIPVLDGGHIVFIIFEIFNGGVLSRSKMEFAQKIGLSLLLGLMIFVIFNDISRYLF